MRSIRIDRKMFTPGTELLRESADGSLYRLPPEGAGISLPQLLDCGERYLVFRIEAMEEHSIAMNFLVYAEEEKPAMTIRFGLLPGVETTVCIDLEWLGANQLFPEALPGELKLVCHGRRVDRSEVRRFELVSLPAFHELTVRIQDMALTDEYPENIVLPEKKLVDCFGQNKNKEWPGKIRSGEELEKALKAQAENSAEGYPFAGWSTYGGWKEKKLQEGTGYFTKCKADGRWWLVDPEGYAFFSMGPDCVNVAKDCRVDGVEKWLDWLPDREDPVFGEFFRAFDKRKYRRRHEAAFSYAGANLRRAFGPEWYETWKKMITAQLKGYGMNTLGNWSDERLFGTTGIPYVTSLPAFPATPYEIFRDFPDVFSPDYKENAMHCARLMEKENDRRKDPFMIGYFLRNEPGWAFVDNLVLADEVLYNPHPTACKERLIAFLQERYRTAEELNRAWGTDFAGFEELRSPQKDISKRSEASARDMREFSRRMLRAYVEIPVRACREVDPNHMILGMRWAWISNPDLVEGWENFDVFSINCYAQDPTAAIQNVVNLGVDLPVMIGEFHFGALDAGPTATGLEGVRNQRNRGLAYRYYCERAAAHPNGVGAHYFQCYDQFVLGRFDGENYNIGLFDICSRPYQEMLEAALKCSEGIYRVADGQQAPTQEKAEAIPMIAY